MSGGAPNGGSPNGGTSSGGTEGGPEKPRLAVTADFLNQTLSIIDLTKLVEGSKALAWFAV